MLNKVAFLIGVTAVIFTFHSIHVNDLVRSLINFNNDSLMEESIIKSWSYLIQRPVRDRNLKISIGLNTNVDLILSSTQLFKNLNLEPITEPVDYPKINSLDELQNTFAYYFKKGHAAERFISNINDFHRIIDATTSLDKHWFIGGNAALMAESISKRFQDVEVMLVGPIGPKLKSLLNAKIKIPNEILIENDEIHLIMEYSIHETFLDFIAPTANRFIISHDVYNSQMEMVDKFFHLTQQYEIDLIILSGLHLLESQTDQFKDNKLKKLNTYLEKLNPKTGVHLELASIGDKTLMQMILSNGIFNSVDSIGLNEQELLFISHAADGPHTNYFKELRGMPNTKKVVDIIEWIFNKYGKTKDSKTGSSLTRIHFHYLLYHIVAISDETKWSNTVSSLLSGSKIASKQACNYDFDSEETNEFQSKVHYRIGTSLYQVNENEFYELNRTNPVLHFKRKDINFYLTPVLVCKNPIKTVGLGDAISSYGLLYALYNNN